MEHHIENKSFYSTHKKINNIRILNTLIISFKWQLRMSKYLKRNIRLFEFRIVVMKTTWCLIVDVLPRGKGGRRVSGAGGALILKSSWKLRSFVLKHINISINECFIQRIWSQTIATLFISICKLYALCFW